jgi:DnaJ-domain-containing protein 1
MNYQSLPELVNQAQQLLSQIQQHPHFQALRYHPDVTIGDASQAIEELRTEIAGCTGLDVSIFEGFRQ